MNDTGPTEVDSDLICIAGKQIARAYDAWVKKHGDSARAQAAWTVALSAIARDLQSEAPDGGESIRAAADILSAIVHRRTGHSDRSDH